MGAAAIPLMIAATVATTAVTAYSQVQAGKAARAAARADADLRASQARAERLKHIRELRRALSAQNNAFGARGQGGGTAAAIQSTTLELGSVALDAQYYRQLTAARLVRQQGNDAYRAGIYGAAGTLFQGGANLFSLAAPVPPAPTANPHTR